MTKILSVVTLLHIHGNFLSLDTKEGVYWHIHGVCKPQKMSHFITMCCGFKTCAATKLQNSNCNLLFMKE